jgi:plastocyanin
MHLMSERRTGPGRPWRFATRIAVASREIVKHVTLGLMLAVVIVCQSTAGQLTVNVIDPASRGVEDVVITLTPPTGSSLPLVRQSAPSAVMDQRNRAFAPRVLVVPVGASVEFPNNDSVSHEVYSFSAAKRFQLPLYKGDHHSPVVFDQEGLVVLGCNIHDDMAGYIYVTSAPYFGKTDSAGLFDFKDIPAGDYQLQLWSPRIADPAPSLARTIHVDSAEPSLSRVKLAQEIRARPEPRTRRGDWEY